MSRVKILTPYHVKCAIDSFGPLKAAGPDGFKPIVLQHLPPNSLLRLSFLFKASLLLGYVPKAWRLSNVIFIPKPSKDDYTKVRSFRPISLCPFIFKAMEKVVLWDLEEHFLRENPFHKHQHAFRKGRSTDSALDDFVDEVEASALRGEFAVGVFLDISGAFDNVQPDALIAAMTLKGFPPLYSKWYSYYLRHRKISTELRGHTTCRHVRQGTPQGGVLSTMAWNMVFDGLLDLFNYGPVACRGFADDASLLARGHDLPTIISLLQEAVDRAVEWGRSTGLSFNALKTQIVIFTLKTQWKTPPLLRMGGVEIPFSSTAKYLGLTLDHKLTWNDHISDKIKKCKGLLMNLVQSIGFYWGPSPRLTKWAYTGVVLPSLMYGSLVWHRACQRKGVRNSLQRLQGLAMRCLAPQRKGSPTQGLEVILNLIPLDLLILESASKAFLRTKPLHITRWESFGHGQLKGHRYSLLDDPALVEAASHPLDTIERKLSWHNQFEVDKASFFSGEDPRETRTPLVAFTDGSHIDNLSGAGFVLYQFDHGGRCGSIVDTGSLYMGPLTTVFQAEIRAIQMASDYVLASAELTSFTEITFFSDSQAALQALSHHFISSSLVSRCVDSLNVLADKMIVTLKWVKGHIGIRGNEIADKEAKAGTKIPISQRTDEVFPVPATHVKNIISTSIRSRWEKRWRTEFPHKYLETRIWFPTLRPRVSNRLFTLGRPTLGTLIQFFTGHCYLMKHRHRQSPHVDPTCRLCCEDDETPWHLISECPALWATRGDNFLSFLPDLATTWTTHQLTRFLQVPHVGELFVPTDAD